MNELNPNPLESLEPRPTRTVLLSVLCVLTYIGSGLSLVSNLLFGLFYDSFVAMIDENPDLFGNFPGLDIVISAGPSYFLSSTLFYGGSLFGAFSMWHLKKAGFHFYTVSQIILILLPMIFFKLPGIPYGAIFISGFFVFLYSINLKYMH